MENTYVKDSSRIFQEKYRIAGILVGIIFSLFSFCNAEQYHYNDIIIGERASGLGGAFSAISDDPSGAFYNPAGLAFSDKSYISISANTYKYSSSQYKNILRLTPKQGSRDWDSNSSAFIPTYFGILQDFNQFKFAFSVITPKADVFNQDTLTSFDTNNSANMTEFLRNYDERSLFYMIGPSVGMLINDSFALGASVFVTSTGREWIDNQWINYKNQIGNWGSNVWQWQNVYWEESSYGMMGIFGAQYMPSKQLSVSLVLKEGIDFYAKAKRQDMIATSDVDTPALPKYTETTIDLLSQGYRSFPLSLTSGMAFFVSPSLLWTADISWYFPYNAPGKYFSNKEMINAATGLEYYLTLNTPIRFGVYANNSSLAYTSNGAKDIDLLGTTFSVGWETEFSSLSLGIDYSFGKGKIYMSDEYGVLLPFSADMKNLSVTFSGSYMM
ncbi:MAG: hypothetical protein DKM50_13005 [Candidatus Margulisiibacteriota bacterium]|nr:MAG: hypothetical protein A2X43_11195 [Candidatus Margulisbacteria bacterium GWD2_39_127]OGI02791.1 MAG: hypothetical protein A2X42_02020 [Candidatus Margulisbacteria bacterium GWF2_38_17]OGI09322.1 MAG: hypothetical protein A2X41_09355 [Candidatus Margulisbacteria bacterium GWE2_39_32]PZM77392.1 MAG: hypothetical protein DKM50_13005 [Candidatus Margulisiibacteriota bacterium]HAR63971.1 hypothetical protein [Candidatus Margulisiibacteriota bacterium]